MKRLLETALSRRAFLKRALVGGSAALVLPWFSALSVEARTLPGEVSGRIMVHNLHTGENLRTRYLEKNGRWIPKSISRLNYLFRCHHNGAVKPIDPALYLLMDRIHTRLAAGNRPFMLVSGYRSPAYNRLLRSRSRRVAKESYHLKGMAADIYIEGIRLDTIQKEAMELARGGVGAYSEFIHVDIGPVRCW